MVVAQILFWNVWFIPIKIETFFYIYILTIFVKYYVKINFNKKIENKNYV